MIARKETFKSVWKYKCFTDYDENGVFFHVIDIEKPIEWAEFLTNGKLYYDSLKSVIDSFNGRHSRVLYHGENINVWQPDIFLQMDGCGNFYRNYHFDDSILKKYENIA